MTVIFITSSSNMIVIALSTARLRDLVGDTVSNFLPAPWTSNSEQHSSCLTSTLLDKFTGYRFRKAGYQAIDRICDHYNTIEGKPVRPSVEPGYLRNALPGGPSSHPLFTQNTDLPVPAAPPTKGEDIEDIANDFQNLIMPGVVHWQHPSFFAYFPAAGTLESIIGDLYAAMAMNPGFNVHHPLPSFMLMRLTPPGFSGCVALRVQSWRM